MSPTTRSILVLLLGGGALLFAANLLVQSPAYRIPKDYPEYWSAGKLNLRGENPYDAAKLLALQQEHEPERLEPLMMWNPPPALALYMPLALVPFKLASLLWVGGQLVAVLGGCALLWLVYEGRDKILMAVLAGLVFTGTWWMVTFGQNTGLILLGLAGFLYFWQTDKPYLAGAFAALTALKPHLLAGFGVLLLLEAFTPKGRKALVAGLGVIALSLGVAVLANPGVLEQYLSATRNPGPGAIPLRDWAIPMPSYWLRRGIDMDQFWIQFAPSMIACTCLVAWRVFRRSSWNWKDALPLVVAVSVIASPYGWVFDLTVLLVPVIWAASRLNRSNQPVLLVALCGGLGLLTVISLIFVTGLHEYWWVAPAVLGLCCLGFCGREPLTGPTE
jgi:hypothetical protein